MSIDHVAVAIATGASFSECEKLRYTLRRSWLLGEGEVAWVCLNPSTADCNVNDPTVRRTIGYAKMWGYRATWMLNLFAWRDTHPEQLKIQTAAGVDVVGPDNDAAILAVAARVDRVILAWGNHGEFLGRAEYVLNILKPYRSKLYRLGELTGAGFPRHPLYVPNDVRVRQIDAPADTFVRETSRKRSARTRERRPARRD